MGLMAGFALLPLARPVALAQTGPLLVFAAASLQGALTALSAEWTRAKGQAPRFSFASSSSLARQLDQGAPAHLFASADTDWMDWAETRRLIRPETRRNRLSNRLVLIEPQEKRTDLRIAPGVALAHALGDSRLAMGVPNAVPAGRYARQALEALGVWTSLEKHIAGAENVRVALALVARGEARFGIVYESDARSEPRVRVVDHFPEASHSPILYPFAETTAPRHPDAGAYLEFLSTPAARRIFEAEGFRVIG